MGRRPLWSLLKQSADKADGDKFEKRYFPYDHLSGAQFLWELLRSYESFKSSFTDIGLCELSGIVRLEGLTEETALEWMGLREHPKFTMSII